MTCDELINLAFENKQKYAPEALYDFRQDSDLRAYLHAHYPEAYDFLHLPHLTIKDYTGGIAAIAVMPQLTLYLNPHKLTFMKQHCGLLHVDTFYKTFACLILHEEMHYVLRHFRFPFGAYNHHLLNVAQDMVIDNKIHLKNPQWRNWQQKIDEINQAIAQQQRTLLPLSTDPEDPHFLLRLSDIDIYFYLESLHITRTNQDPPQFDEHTWNEEQPVPSEQSGDESGNQEGDSPNTEGPCESNGNTGSNNSASGETGEKSSELGDSSAQNAPTDSNEDKADSAPYPEEKTEKNSQPSEKDTSDEPFPKGPSESAAQSAEKENLNNPPDYDDILGDLAKSARERLSQNESRPWINQDEQEIDHTLQIVAKGKDHNLFALLKKFIKKISYKQRTLTWKKISKKQPCIKPGSIYKKTPGEVLILIDTSYSMYPFIANHIADTMNGIYTAFAQVARNYGMPSKIYKSDFADKVLNFKKIKTVEELRNIELAEGGYTSLATAFKEVVDPWRKITKSTQKTPDFILIITDFGDDYNFLKGNKYKGLSNKIIWLCTEPRMRMSNSCPPVGIVVDVLADDWSTSIR